jgi:hypothetical protein
MKTGGVTPPSRREILADRAVACWHLARKSRLFSAVLLAMPIVVVAWIAGAPNQLVLNAARILLLLGLFAFIRLAPEYRRWAETAPPLRVHLTLLQRAGLMVVVICFVVASLGILGWLAGG